MLTQGDGQGLGLHDLGGGVGPRSPHYPAILDRTGPDADKPHPGIDWFEIIAENFMVAGGRPMANLDRVLERYRVVQHGVSLSIGSSAPLDRDYLAKLKALHRKVR